MTEPHRCSCCDDRSAVDRPRRRVIGIAAAGLVSPFAMVAARASTGPVAGDLLVEEDAEGAPAPLRAADLRPGRPLLAYPFDANASVVRNESRLNKITLMRFADDELPPALKSRAAGGVIAYSAICTHQGCDVKTWLSKEQVLVCYCHSSKFQPLDDAKVVGGPASRPLPSLPLRLDGDRLVIAGPFSASPGGAV